MTSLSFSILDLSFVGIQALKTKSEKATEKSPKRKRQGTVTINLFHKYRRFSMIVQVNVVLNNRTVVVDSD